MAISETAKAFATVSIKVGDQEFTGNGEGACPGTAMTAANKAVMRKVREVIPKNKKQRERHSSRA